MSDSEEESFCYYGKPLDPYDEDSIPKKRPISVEEQIATDAQGRRRFHGAFTGGFSAGFFNTVGSLEGWTPAEFRSSRQEKAQSSAQRPEDFMDEEDRGEFGIAPETVRATSDYANTKKRKKQLYTGGPIPGEPVLQTLIESGNETIGYLLLKNIGLKHGGDEESSSQKIYGCAMPTKYEITRSLPTCEIPKIYEDYLKNPKINTFGMGYSGLDKSHVNLFQSSAVVSREKNKKGFSITGQAFGVGAFEEDDDDIYAREDMSNYDFELGGEKTKKKAKAVKSANSVFDTFVHSKIPLINKIAFPPPIIPRTFTGKYKNVAESDVTVETDVPNTTRVPLNTFIRSRYLGEEISNTTVTPSSDLRDLYGPSTSAGNNSKPPPKTDLSKKTVNNVNQNDNGNNTTDQSNVSSTLLYDRFVSASTSDDHTDILAPVVKAETLHGTKEMRDAAKMKMFGPLTRIHLTWTPCALLCKRFNVPEPKFSDMPKKERKRTTHLIFEYQQQAEDEPALKPGLTVKEEPETVMDFAEEQVEEPSSSNNILNTTLAIKQNENADPNIPKTLDITDKVDVEKNIDLFKAIFLSDSESEEEGDKEENVQDNNNEDTERTEILKSNVLGETLIPKIRPVKEGILSNIDFSVFSTNKNTADQNETTSNRINSVDSAERDLEKFSKSAENKDKERCDNRDRESNAYGPKLPDLIMAKNSQKIISIPESSGDEWVEKDKYERKKSHKHKKKHKKEKHKKKHKKDKR